MKMTNDEWNVAVARAVDECIPLDQLGYLREEDQEELRRENEALYEKCCTDALLSKLLTWVGINIRVKEIYEETK